MEHTKKYYHEINIARAIALLFVVLGHSIPDAQTTITHPAAQEILNICYSFHMGLFFLLSGFVFANRFLTGDYQLAEQLKNKFCRLMVPYFIYSVITLLLKLAFAKYANNSFELKEFYKIFLGENPNGGLWYLWTLFMIMVMFLLIGKSKHRWILAGVITVALYIACLLVPHGFYSKLMNYPLYFLIGILLFRYYGALKKIIASPITGLAALAVFVLLHIFNLNSYYLFTCIAASIFILCISIRLSACRHDKPVFRTLSTLGTYSYDIYLLSYFVQVPIRVLFYSIFPIPYWLLFAVMFFGGLIIPYFASKWIFRKIPLTNFLLLGNRRKA